MLGFCSSARFIEHDTGPHHPERPDRIRVIHQAVRDAGLLRSPYPFPDFRLALGLKPLDGISPMIELGPMPADERWLRMVHPIEHIERVRQACANSELLDQGDTPVEPRSFPTALLAVGAALTCCDAVIAGKVKRAFAAVRPPGHHAEPNRAMGFCLFSNVAIAARYLQKHHGMERVAIVDFDVHHGNGTQAVFYEDPTVLFISLHQHPDTCYPGTGYETEIGTGAGSGYTLSLPMQPGCDDRDYLAAIESRVVPKLDEFRPEMLLLSAGFDAHQDDPLAQMKLTEDGFEMITRRLLDVANQHCDGKVVSLLEGGYNLAALGRSVVRHLVAMGS
jgi:acetoin utilization deacetylase AcuC-like enzyme